MKSDITARADAEYLRRNGWKMIQRRGKLYWLGENPPAHTTADALAATRQKDELPNDK